MKQNNNEFHPQPGQLDEIQQFYEQGRYLTAYQKAVTLAPLPLWRGKAGRLMAARIANMLNQNSLSRVLFYRAWKEYPEDHEVIYETARNKRQLGIYRAWCFIRQHDPDFTQEPGLKARWLALKGNILARLRNFKQADEYIHQALALSDDPWLRCEHAYILEFEDRYEASLEVIEQLLTQHPDYRPAYQQKAYLLQLMRRDDEARQCLQEAYNKFESIHVGGQWLDVLIEEAKYEPALAVCEELDTLLPIKRRHEQAWLLGRKVDTLCQLRRYDEACELAEEFDSPFFTKVLQNLREAGPQSRRNVLPVTFIRQHHNTCGPATMSAICHYHGSEVDQQAIIDSIWYDGTYDVDERQWCLEHDWQVTEFRLDWDSTRALIDAGFPIAVTTVEPDSAHLQAVIGYDEFRGTLLIRDPYERNEQEFLAEEFFQGYEVYGPRALLIYPPQKAALPATIDLPEREQYDAFFNLQLALKKHQRAEAMHALHEMESRWPESRMTLLARRRLGYYDGDAAYILHAVQQLLERYPDYAGLQLNKQEMLYQLGYLSERKQYLDEVYSSGKMHNSVLLEYVEVLLQDKRHAPLIYQIVKRLLLQRPSDPVVYFRLGNLRWAQRQFDESLELYQIAANLAQFDEFYALKYFHAARSLHREEEVLAWLQKRHQDALGKSSQPAITLYKALAQLDREPEGFRYLNEAKQGLPQDDSLLIFLCNKYIENGQLQEAEDLLPQIKDRVRELDWLMSSAFLCEQQQEYESALKLRHRVVELQPLREAYQKNYANLLGQLRGYTSKIDYLKQLVERYPDNFDFYELLLDSMEQGTAEEKETLLRKLLTINPDYAWAQRELAIQLGRQLKMKDAFEAIARAEQLDPHNPGLYTSRASLHLKQRDIEAAKADYRKAVSLSVDTTYASRRLLDISAGTEAKNDALTFIRQQLIEQVTNGDAILSYSDLARQVLPADEVLQQLQEALQARPDLWESWAAVMSLCQDIQQYDKAEEYARQACERFPYIPRLWVERSRNFRYQGDYAREQAYLQKALEINPNYTGAIRDLSENLEHQGKYEEALSLLTEAVQHHQLDEVMHVYLADLQWRMGMEEAAFRQMTTAIELDPDYGWAWNRLKEWSETLGREEEAEALAARILKQRPGDSRAWLQMAKLARDFNWAKECIEQAIELAPADILYRQEQIKLLVKADAYQEALQAYEAAGELNRDIELQSYHPWILRCMGKVDEAVEIQRSIMQAHPDYADGWRVLARWARTKEDIALEQHAAEQYARLEAHDVNALTYYGEVLLKQGEVDQALAQYEKALALEPKDVDANLELFDLYLQHDYLDRAETLLQHMRVHMEGRNSPYVDARQGQLYALQGNKQAALSQLKALAQSDENNTWLINSILEKMETQGWLDEINPIIDEWIEDVDQYGPSLTRVWARRQAEKDDWLVGIDSIRRLMTAGEGGVYIVDAYLDYLVDKEEYERFLGYVDQHKRVLRAHDQTWATIGYHYTNLHLHDEAVKWMADWKKRKTLQTWSLRNLALSYRHQFRWKKCLEVCRHGLTLETDNGQNSMRIWSALEYALAGDQAQLFNQLALIEPEDFSPSEGFCYRLVQAIEAFHEQGGGPDLGDQLVQRLKKIRKRYEHYKEDPPSARLYGRVSYKLANELSGFPGNLLWFLRFIF